MYARHIALHFVKQDVFWWLYKNFGFDGTGDVEWKQDDDDDGKWFQDDDHFIFLMMRRWLYGLWTSSSKNPSYMYTTCLFV